MANHETTGTGVLVSAAGMAVTCAHVVEACGVDPRLLRGDNVLVRMPKTPLHEQVDRLAKVMWFPEQYEDDLVVLELSGGPVPPERVGVCGPAGDEGDGQPFQSWGFRLRGDYTRGLMARGMIDTHVASERNYLHEPLQLTSAQLDSGMSGSAVLDLTRNLVIGFVFRVWESGESAKDRDLAFAVDAGLLAESPLADEIVTSGLPLAAISQPAPCAALDHPPVVSAAALVNQPVFTEPPAHLGRFVGREPLLGFLDAAWANTEQKLAGLYGAAGIGKTSLIRQWLTNLAGDNVSIFWWTFDPEKQEEDDFLTALITHLSVGNLDARDFPTARAKANLAAFLLKGLPRMVIVLDDVTAYQIDRGDLYGCFRPGAIKDFIDYVISADQQTMTVLTSDLPFPELENQPGAACEYVDQLAEDDGMHLLAENGIHGDPDTMRRLVVDWGGHPQALTAVAIYLKSRHLGVARPVTDLPGVNDNDPLDARLQAVGEAIQDRRQPDERTALEIMALARGPLPPEALIGVLSALGDAGLTPPGPPDLGNLFRSEAVRASVQGFIPHPVLRNLYRARLRTTRPEFVATVHRLLAAYYFVLGTT